jgi:phospholipid/cholesterol/gamma-HCH transport system permease protein
MEASGARAGRNIAPGGQSTLGLLTEGFVSPVRGVLTEVGELAIFVGRTLLELRGVWRYTAEILRQAGILIVGSAAVICFMEFVMGLECGTEADYVLRGYGATIYSGVFTAYCAVRECVPYMFGYILSAKVGCGLVAEIGSMRINEELDAMEAIGLNPMRYVVCTRLVAAWLVLPLIYLIGMGFHFLADWLVIVVQIGDVSQAGWQTIHWMFINPTDILYSEIKGMTEGTAIVLVGMYYGFRAKGGPVGVGTATARSMILNLILVHLFGSMLTMLFWGVSPHAPVGG